jgi:hypothetical protein
VEGIKKLGLADFQVKALSKCILTPDIAVKNEAGILFHFLLVLRFSWKKIHFAENRKKLSG